jgi:hypothetical protein
MIINKNTLVLCFMSVVSIAFAMDHPGDSIIAQHADVVPVIDGNDNDACWNNASWIDINYMWMPYNTAIAGADFTGRYKVMWNENANLLYFLAEITDDKFVNGYVFSTKDGSYPNFDVLEVFIDEDRPGGDHALNNTAFAYHLTGGNSTTDFDAVDIYDPTNSYNWGAGIYVNSKLHLPEFKRTNAGTKYIWEFSLKVIKSNYKPTDNSELFKATLLDGKKMGLTLAYCDNDNSAINPKRDNFIASKYETQANNDISWKNSSTFAHLTLRENAINSIRNSTDFKAGIWFDSSKQLHILMDENSNSVFLKITDISGKMLIAKQVNGNQVLDFSPFSRGFYLVELQRNNLKITQKILY